MPDLLWWVQVVGGALSILVAAGIIAGAVYSSVREAPSFVKEMIGYKDIEMGINSLRADQKLSQELQLQQAEAFNDLSEVVCDEHDIHAAERPKQMNTQAIRTELMDRDETDFTRRGD